MNQNFNNEPNFGANEENNRAPLPEFQGSEQPKFDYNETVPSDIPDPEVQSIVESSFKKALAAAIMTQFPITSIIAIIFGRKSWKMIWEAEELAKQRNVRAGGKSIAVKIMSVFGMAAGGINTVLYALLGVIYGLYFLLIILMMLAEM